MKLVLRNSLFVLGLMIGFSRSAFSQEILTKNPEVLDKQFMQIEVSNENSISVSVLQSIQDLTQLIQTRFFSLLNWKLHSRATQLEVANYDRLGQFGRWINDTEDDVCLNTRAKVLLRDSKKNVIYKENNHCVVSEGAWKDPYTAQIFRSASEIQIDHLVPLKNAYMSGAYKWNFKARCLYANYLGYDFHLLSVLGTENMKKSDKAPDKYMPPDSRYACTYVRNWLAVKMFWGLTMTLSEARAVRQIILDQKCPTASFRLSEAEWTRQRRFTDDNVNLCEAVDKTLH